MSSPFSKNDKWLLASHLQKAIRRGWADEAAWAAGHLHQVDRAYLAYRLSVMAVEDVGAGDPQKVASFLDPSTPWGAKRFGPKNDDTAQQWQAVATAFAQSTKDRTPCEWMGCTRWLQEFEQAFGPWAAMSCAQGLRLIYDEQQPWWARGLGAWRAAGTDRFPSSFLPECGGQWEAFVEAAPKAAQEVLTGYGARQREAHPVFLPLALVDQDQQQAKPTVYAVSARTKVGPWIAPAIDKHTGEGKRALSSLLRLLEPHVQQELMRHGGKDGALEILGKLMFWLEGGHVDKALSYPTATTIANDCRQRWLRDVGLSGKWLYEHCAKLDLWNAARGVDVQPPFSSASSLSL